MFTNTSLFFCVNTYGSILLLVGNVHHSGEAFTLKHRNTNVHNNKHVQYDLLNYVTASYDKDSNEVSLATCTSAINHDGL